MVQTAITPEEVRSIVRLAEAELGTVQWRDLGDRSNNAGTVQIASSPSAALVERVTNSIDGMLELKAEEEGGPLPASPREAARDWFGIPRKGPGELSDSERRRL